MRIKILAHQKGEIHHFFKPKFAAFYHWKMPHIWTLFRLAAPPAPKRGENILKGIRGPDTPPVSPSAWPAQPAGLNGRGSENPPLSRSPRDLPRGRSRGPYCASAHTAACPPGALLMTAAGADFFLDGYKGASARPTSAPGGLEALTPRQRPKNTPAGTLPHVFLRLSASGPHGPEGGAGSPAQEQRRSWQPRSGWNTVPQLDESLDFYRGMV